MVNISSFVRSSLDFCNIFSLLPRLFMNVFQMSIKVIGSVEFFAAAKFLLLLFWEKKLFYQWKIYLLVNWTGDIIYSEMLLVVSNKHFIGCKIPVYRHLIAWIITVNMVHLGAKNTAKIKSENIEIKHFLEVWGMFQESRNFVFNSRNLLESEFMSISFRLGFMILPQRNWFDPVLFYQILSIFD